MSHIYITNNGSVLSVKGGRFVIVQKDGLKTSIPKETVESVSVFGNSSITTPCVQTLLESKIPVSYFSSTGKYYGRLEESDGNKIVLLKKQFIVFDEYEFKLNLSKKFVRAKINNQCVLLRRYIGHNTEDSLSIVQARKLQRKVIAGESVDEIMGYEGMAARIYFDVLSNNIHPEFKFYGRNRRPPKDAFNSLLSFGYTLLLHEIMSKIESTGLSPYLGLLHKERDNSPALASDMMEEWRAVIVDATVMSMIQGNEISIDDFESDENEEGIYIRNDALKKYIKKFERKLASKAKYLAYDDKQYTFRTAMDIQCSKIREAVMDGNADVYKAIEIR